MDFSSIDWPSFRAGLGTGIGLWLAFTILYTGWTRVDHDDRFDVFDEADYVDAPRPEADVCLMCRLDVGGSHPHADVAS